MEKPFRIFEITEELVNNILSNPYEAHLHDFEEIIIVAQGSLEHYIDFKIEALEAPMACYVSMGKTHKLVPHQDLKGWVINYKSEYLPDSELNFYSDYFTSTNISLAKNNCLQRCVNLCKIIDAESQQSVVEFASVSHLIYALISLIDSERKRNLPLEFTSNTSQVKTFKKFLKILNENFRLDAGVSFYAEKLNMSERSLNNICKSNFQKSVSEIIETRKLTEAKQLLIHSDKTVSEIGFELGYNEKSYFTRVFHAKTEMTPSQFREMTKALIPS